MIEDCPNCPYLLLIEDCPNCPYLIDNGSFTGEGVSYSYKYTGATDASCGAAAAGAAAAAACRLDHTHRAAAQLANATARTPRRTALDPEVRDLSAVEATKNSSETASRNCHQGPTSAEAQNPTAQTYWQAHPGAYAITGLVLPTLPP